MQVSGWQVSATPSDYDPSVCRTWCLTWVAAIPPFSVTSVMSQVPRQRYTPSHPVALSSSLMQDATCCSHLLLHSRHIIGILHLNISDLHGVRYWSPSERKSIDRQFAEISEGWPFLPVFESDCKYCRRFSAPESRHGCSCQCSTD